MAALRYRIDPPLLKLEDFFNPSFLLIFKKTLQPVTHNILDHKRLRAKPFT